jgi:hypothetical protein
VGVFVTKNIKMRNIKTRKRVDPLRLH